MRLFRHDSDLPADAHGAVVTLGNFDGVHLGHQAVIGAAAKIARATGKPLAVLTFEPHTKAFFRPDLPPFRLTPLRAKLHALETLGVDQVIALAFDEAFSKVSAEDFAGKVLCQHMRISHAVAGGDFRYGHKHAGTMDSLIAAGVQHGFGVTRVDPVSAADGTVYSATAIRKFIAEGDMRGAAALLGRPWEIDGHVVGGDKRGRELGFPTANIKLGEYLRPAFGIYAVRACLDRPGAPWIDGVANLGIRPMWQTEEPVLEAHLFDFSEDIYGQVLRVRLIERLRPEGKFDSVEALVAQVDRDKLAAREALLASEG
ncbi:MAG TPA: bifunctional riboflavin kinase/FAD synthetase [Alphaproteobacteria bacterium]|jgi:riboflavin kinase/FMN adenylyltransferase|nr:bifunctional riboflavin kinase/FAD synthetase [Alphaproteobacteria bacterium]